MLSPWQRSVLRAILLSCLILLPGTPYIVSAEEASDSLTAFALAGDHRLDTEEAQARVGGAPPDEDELRSLSQTPPLSGANPPYPRNHVLDGLQQSLGTPPSNHDFETSPTSTGTPPTNHDIETSPLVVGMPPTNHDFETGDLTGWTTSGTVTVASDAPHGSYAKLSGNNAEIVSAAFTVDSAGQIFAFDTGFLANPGWSWVKVYVLSGPTYGTATLLGDVNCNGCGSWQRRTFSVGSWTGQSVKLQFVRSFGEVGIDDVQVEQPLPSLTPTGTSSRLDDAGDHYVELKMNATLTTEAFTVASDAQVGSVQLMGRSSFGDQYQVQVLSGVGYTTATTVASGTVADAWTSIQFMLAEWQGQSIKLKVRAAFQHIGVDDLAVQGIELPGWTVDAATELVRVEASGEHYLRLAWDGITTEAFTVDAAAQQVTLQYRAGSLSSQFDVELLHGTNYSQVTALDTTIQTTEQVTWQTFTAAIDDWAGESVKLRIEQNFGWGEYDLAGVTEQLLPGWSLGTQDPVVVGEDAHGGYVTGMTAANGNGNFRLASSLISTGILDASVFVEQHFYAVAYDIGYRTGALIRVYWHDAGSGQSWTVYTAASDTPTGYQVGYFPLSDWMGTDGYFEVQVADEGGKVYSLADNIARQQLSEPFSEQVGYQIDTSTGSFGYQVQDLATAGVMPLQFVRYYNGHADHYGTFGYRWTHSYDTRLVVLDGDDAGVIFGSGREVFFDWITTVGQTPHYEPADPRNHDELVKNGDGSYTYTNTANLSYHFDADGVLLTISDLNGNTVTLTRDGQGRVTSVTNTAGRTLTLTYDGNGRIATASDPVGAMVEYGYDANGDLTTVTDPEDQVWTYVYDRHRLVSVTAPDATVLFTNTFDDWHRVTTQTLADGATIELSYDTPGQGATEVTDPEGNTATYYFDKHQRTTHQIDPLGNRIEYQYDADGNRARVIDPAFNEWDFAYDADGNLTDFDDPQGNGAAFAYSPGHLPTTMWDVCGNMSTLGYDGDGNVTSLTNALNQTSTMTYDAMGNVLTETVPGAGTTTHTYDAQGNRTSTTDPAGNTTTATYDANGRMISQTDPNGNTTTITYDLFGRPTVVRDSLGNELTSTFDVLGYLLKQTDQLGNETLWAYDSRGNPVQKRDTEGNIWTFTYDDAGRMLSETDPLNNTTSYTYDAAGRLTSVTNAEGDGLTYGYDSAGRVVSITDDLGRTISRGFDAAGRLVSITMPNGAMTTVTYDACGNLATVTDPWGYTITYGYNALNQKISETDSNSVETTYTYDSAGRLTSVTDDQNHSTSYTYDTAGRIATVTDVLTGVTSYGYDEAGNVTSITDPLNRTTTNFYDDLNRLISTTDPLNNTTSYQYDAAGRQTQVTLPSGANFSTTYDTMGRVLTETDPLNQVTSYAYDDAGRLASVTDPLNRVTSFGYDAAGRQTTMIDALNGVVTFGYDAAGRRTSVTNANGKTTSFAYGLNGNVTNVTDPLNRVTTYGYDTYGRQTSMTDPRGVTVGYVYDAAGNISTVTYPGGSISYNYDTLGRRTSMTDATGTTSWSYDALGQVTSVTSPQGAVNYTYDLAGQRTSMTQPGNRTVSYGYDLGGRFASLTDWQSQVTSFGYDVDGRRTSITRPNGVTSSYTYDLLGQVTAIDHSSSGCLCSLQSYSYTYDAAGNRTSVTTAAGTESYGYDALNRLTSVTYPNSDVESFTYDANGNRLTYALNGQTLNTYSYDDADQLTSDGVVTYSHDLAGNLVQAGSDTYTWDWKNRLTGSTVGGTTASYSYDGDDVRVSQTAGGQTSWYVYDRLSGLPLLIDDGNHGYVHAGGVLEQVDGQGTTDWLLNDALGSVRGVSDGAGALSGTADYAAFGSVRSQTGTSSVFGFTGEQTDAATGNLYLRARYHDPSTGRFLSADTVQPNAPGTQGYNRYSYTANNPATWTDPSGQFAQLVSALEGGMTLAVEDMNAVQTLTQMLNGAGTAARAAFASGVARLALFGSVAIGWFINFITPLIALLWAPFVRIVAAILIFVAAMVLAAVLIHIVVELLELVDMWVNAGWAPFVEGVGPAVVVDWTVEGVQTAVQTYPLFPERQPCTVSGVTTEVAQGIFWSTLLNGGMLAYSMTDMLLDIGMACFSGNSSSGGSGLKEVLEGLSDRGFRRFVKSIEGEAARAGAATRTLADTQTIIDEALARGWRIDRARGIETAWVGGPHIHLIDPMGNNIHLPVPTGFKF